MVLRKKVFQGLLSVFAVWGTLVASMVRMNSAQAETYGSIFDFLVAHTRVVELIGEHGERVAVCPDYQGRVMTSTTSDKQGHSFGWINKDFINREEKDRHFNNYGGEDRFWLGPEGGPYSLWFAHGTEQKLTNWVTPPVLNDGSFKLISNKEDPHYRMSRQMKFQNAAQTTFDLEIVREIRLQKIHHFGKLFGSEAQKTLESSSLKMVGFQSINTVMNRGPAMHPDKGLLAIWSLGQFPSSPNTQIIIPYQAGDEAELGPIVNSGYFGKVPDQRLRVTPEAIWFLGDAKYRAKIGVSPKRVRPVAGSVDLRQGILTLVHFSMPPEPATFSYVNNSWGRQEQPYYGDVFNSYNDGPPEPGKPALGGFYELESLSPALQLPTGKSLGHTHTTFHIQGDPAALARVAKAVLGVDLKIDEVAGKSASK